MRTIQEKAEAYDKAIEIAKSKIKNDNDHILYEDDIIEIFPELKGDEDEITKRMLDVITYKMSQHQPDIFTSEENEWFNAWLEKQREQKSFDYENANIQQKDFAPKVEPKFQVGDWCIDNEDGIIFQIVKVLDNTYTYRTNECKEYSCTHYSLENDARLWTIQDAKDGDILACNEEILMFKSYSVQNRISLYCWYNVQTNNFHSKEVVDISLSKRNEIYPATKEQRKTLFKVMADGGYVFDFDKKEVNKIEQNPVDNVEQKFHVGDWYQCTKDFFGKGVTFDKNTAYYCAKEGCLQCEYGCHIAIVKDLYDNFKLWTIEDAKDGDVLFSPRHNLLWIFKDKGTYHASINLNYDNNISFDADIVIPCDVCPATKEQRDQLEKAIINAGYEWNKEERKLEKVEQTTILETSEIEHIEDGKYYFCIKDYYAGGCKRASRGDVIQAKGGMNIMSLGVKANEYFIPVNSIRVDKVAWSEEDKGNLLDVKCVIDDAWNNQDFREYTGYSSEELESLWNWLDSIWQRVEYPQDTWKPSDEQLKALDIAIRRGIQLGTWEEKALRSLNEKLKKIKEE